MRYLFISTIMLILLSGCSNAIWVKELNTKFDQNEPKYKKIGGIPFYVKKEIFKQTSVYSKTWLRATLSIKKTIFIKNDDNTFHTQEMGTSIRAVDTKKNNLTRLHAIKSILSTGLITDITDVDRINNLFDSIQVLDISNIDSLEKDDLGNIVESLWVVNEDEKYFLNAPLPWFGTNEFSHELNSDGTLSKSTSKPDTKISEAITSFIPLKEYLTAKHVSPLDQADDSEKDDVATNKAFTQLFTPDELSEVFKNTELVYNISLNIEEVGYAYNFFRYFEDYPESLDPIPFDVKKYMFKREVYGQSKKVVEEKDDSKSIGLTGTIKLPKE